MESPDCHLLGRIRWDLFGTLTYLTRDEEISRRRQLCTWFAFARWVADRSGIHFPRAVWVLRRELTETSARPHLHFLFAGVPELARVSHFRLAAMNAWESLGCGMARIRTYDHALAGVDYIADLLHYNSGTGANEYEARKFGHADELIVSHTADLELRKFADRSRIQRHSRLAARTTQPS
jgi:hypothetical protein